MKSKEKRAKHQMNVWRKTMLLTLLVSMMACFVTVVLYKKTLYKPLILLALVEFLPVAVNFVLLLPRLFALKAVTNVEISDEQENSKLLDESETIGKSESEVEKLKKKKQKEEKAKKRKANFEKTENESKKFYNKYRHILVASLVLVVALAIGVYFLTSLKTVIPSLPKINYVTPTLIFLTWLTYFVLSNFCKYITNEHKNDKYEDEHEEKESTYDKGVIIGLRGGLTIGMIAQVVTFATSIMYMLNMPDMTKYVNIALSIAFFYELVFILISLSARSIRHEMNTLPELNIPVPSVSGNDLSIISYLETQTGMTMRSLWSIRMIKKIIPFCAIFIVLFLWLFSGVVKVEPYQQGAHYRLGQLVNEPLKPGLHITLPYPFSEVKIYDTETIQKMTIGYVSEENKDNLWTHGHGGEEYKLLLGGGKELVSINLRVEYKIDDLNKYVQCSSSPESILQAVAYESITEKTINTDLETLLSSDRAALSADIKDDLTKRASRYDTGLTVVSVVLESIHPPVEIAEIYQKIISAGIEAEEILINAQASAAVKITTAKTRYNTLLSFEKKIYHISIAEAKSEVADFMSSVEADREYGDQYRYRKYLEALARAYSGGKVVIVGEGIDENHIYIGNFGVDN